MKSNLSASLEDYVETIYELSEEKDTARVKDIAERLNVKKGSVTGALHSLADKGLVDYTPYSPAVLTAKGRRIAREITYRHKTLSKFFSDVLSVDKQEAEEVACKMEHFMPAHIVERLALFAAFAEHCPRTGDDWILKFKNMKADEFDWHECESCIQSCIGKMEKRLTDGQADER